MTLHELTILQILQPTVTSWSSLPALEDASLSVTSPSSTATSRGRMEETSLDRVTPQCLDPQSWKCISRAVAMTQDLNHPNLSTLMLMTLLTKMMMKMTVM